MAKRKKDDEQRDDELLDRVTDGDSEELEDAGDDRMPEEPTDTDIGDGTVTEEPPEDDPAEAEETIEPARPPDPRAYVEFGQIVLGLAVLLATKQRSALGHFNLVAQQTIKPLLSAVPAARFPLDEADPQTVSIVATDVMRMFPQIPLEKRGQVWDELVQVLSGLSRISIAIVGK